MVVGICSALLTLVALTAFLAPPASAAPPPSFGTEGTGAGQLSEEPRAIAVEQSTGDVYVADRNSNRIVKFGSEGEFELAFGWGVADGAAEPQTCGPESVPLASTCRAGLEGAGGGELAFPEGIAVDNDPSSASHGDVYVADARNHRVQKFSPTGRFLLAFGGKVNATTEADVCLAGEACQEGTRGTGPGEFEGLGHDPISVDSSGTVYVGDLNRIEKFSPAGAYQSELAFPGVEFVEDVAVDPAGSIYFKGSEQVGVHKYDAAGGELGSPRDLAGAPVAIAVGEGEELLVDDESEGQHVFAYDASGNQLSSFDGGGDEGGRRGIAFGKGLEVVYILNQGRVRIVPVPPPGPLVFSQSATEPQPTTATLNGTINAENSPTTYHFEYGLAACEGGGCASTPTEGPLTGFADRPVSAPIIGLQPRTTYHFRLVATNADGTAKGPDQTFTTLPPVSIETVSASSVSAEAATLETTLNPHGVMSTYRFEYGPTSDYGSTTPSEAVGGLVPVSGSAVIQGLQPGTTYHYRVVAENSLGVVTSTDHTFVTQPAASLLLPDDRAWELVSPPDKHGAALEGITEEGGAVEAAASGDAITYLSKGSIGSNPGGVKSPSYSQLLSSRSSGGWTTQDITTPSEAITVPRAGVLGEYRYFSEELDRAVVEPQGATPLSPQVSERTPYVRLATGEFVPLATRANVPPGTEFAGPEAGFFGEFAGGIEVIAADPGATHIVVASSVSLTAGRQTNGISTLYDWADGSFTPISVLPGAAGELAAEAGLQVGVGQNDSDMRSAVSDGGNRIAFEASNGHLYLRDLALGKTVQLDLPEAGLPEETPHAKFQGASANGDRIFFTDAANLTANSTAVDPGKPDLYMCQIEVSPSGELGCSLSDLSLALNAGEAADVAPEGVVTAIDTTGTHVFFVADGVLTHEPSPEGETAEPGRCEVPSLSALCNLYEVDTASGRIRLVGRIAGTDGPVWDHEARFELANLTARVSPDGGYFAFMSQRSLTGYENRDARTAEPDAEVFLFDTATDTLRCASCNPTGARPRGVLDEDKFPGLLVDRPRSWAGRRLAASIPGWTGGANHGRLTIYQSRYLSDSGRLFFNAFDSLTPKDTNGTADVYEYEPPGVGSCTEGLASFSSRSGGCVSLISSGSSPEESAFLDASESGGDVFFLTAAQLSSEDIDGATDVYDAHDCSTSPCLQPKPAPPAECGGEACRPALATAPGQIPGTASFIGPANPKPKRHHHHKKKKHHKPKKKGQKKTQKKKGNRAVGGRGHKSGSSHSKSAKHGGSK